MAEIVFAAESAASRSLPLSAQRCVNFFTEKQDPFAKSQTPLFGSPGMTLFNNVGNGFTRGACVMNDRAYFVSGQALVEVNPDGTHSTRGTGITGRGWVSMAGSGTQVVAVNGTSGWVYTVATGAFAEITSPSFYPSDQVSFMDGNMVFNRKGTNQWFISGSFAADTFDGLDFATAEAASGFVVGTAQNLGLLFIFTTSHFEIWYDAGTLDFPYQRYAGGIKPYGCTAPATICAIDGALFFLGRDKVFYRLQANDPQRVSTHPIETILNADPDLTQAQCWTYTWEGHKTVVLQLPASNRTLLLDLSTQEWHERESTDSYGNSVGRWRAGPICEAYGAILCGDAYDGRIGKLDWDVFTEYGNTIPGRLVSPPYHAERMWVYLKRLELDIQAGVGLANGQGSDPQVMLRWSRDGGQTWSKYQRFRSMGKIGEFTRRLRWTKLGRARTWVFELLVTDPVKRVILASFMDSAAGVS